LFWRIAESIPFFRRIGYTRKDEWAVQGDATRMDPDGNVVTLGGIQKEVINEIYINPQDSSGVTKGIPLIYLNSHIRNMLKVLIGFIPAFLTFFYTKDWWLLSYFGAFIWFGITGIRNILQSVLGGGGFRRSPMLRWNAYVSWDRIADSLLFTGFSVPLLDYIVKTAVMDNIFGVTTTTNPILLYTAIALTNGIYLSSHNAFRGLQKAAVYGNLFRTVLSIPIAVSINFIAEVFLTSTGTAGAPLVLQKWAAIISKASSDIVAGIIEGTADRYKNIKMRYKEYRKKLTELIDIHSSLELLFPDVRDIELLGYPNNSQKKTSAEIRDLEKIISIHALDALYFWMYQPRSRTALRHLLDSISEEERQIWVSSQFVLLRKKEISQMLIDGVLGNDFAKALSFYLSSYPEYLEAMKKFA
jgi:hypothetical protein